MKGKGYETDNNKDIEKIKIDYQHLEEILKNKNIEYNKLQKDISEKIKELNDTKNQLIIVQNSNELEKKTSNRLTRIIDDLKCNASKNNELIKILKNENMNLKTNNNNNNKEERNKEIFEKKKQKEFESVRKELKIKEDQLEKEKSTNDKLNQQIISMKKALDNLVLENENLKNITSLQELNNKDYKLNTDRYKEKIEESWKNISEKESIIENLKEQIEKLSKELSEYDIINNGLQQDIRESHDTINKLKNNLSEEEKISKEFSKNIDRIQKENDKLVKNINEFKVISDQDKSEIKICHSLNEKLKKEIDEKSLIISELKEELNKCYENNTKLKNDLENNYNSQMKIKEELNACYNYNEKLNKDIENYYNENCEMKKKININYNTINKLKKDLNETNNENENLKGVLYNNKCENENKFKQALLDVQEKITLLQQDLSSNINDNKSLKKKVEEYKNKTKKLQIFNNNLKKETERLQNDINVLTEENSKIVKVKILILIIKFF